MGHGVAAAALLLFAMYAYHGVVAPQVQGHRTGWFGFDRVWRIGPGAALALAAVIGVSWGIARHRARLLSAGAAIENRLARRPWLLLPVGAGFSAVFFLLRNNFVNADGAGLAAKLARDVPRLGFHATHDEMWELVLHSRFWWHTRGWLDWSVPFSYQVLSSVAGGVFVVLLLWYCRRVVPGRAMPMALCVVSGGFMQLFFGDVENYTLTAVAIMAYLVAARLFLEGRVGLAVPAAALGGAMCLHLLAGFLLPSLVFLAWIEGRSKHWRVAMLGVLPVPILLGASLALLHVLGLPVDQLVHRSQAFGYGGPFVDMLARPSWVYCRQILNLAFLLMPVAAFLPPVVARARLWTDRTNAHLGIAAASMLVLLVGWDAKLGVYQDWNLYANVAIPVSLLVAKNLVTARMAPSQWWALAAGVTAGALHSYTWIVGNHVRFPSP